jgi:26S proteasome regulatory subunit N3
MVINEKRLRHNVIKTGVKMMSLSYSKISLENIAQKLQLDSAVDAEFIVAKVKFNNIFNWYYKFINIFQ